jgi:hypothetical protein
MKGMLQRLNSIYFIVAAFRLAFPTAQVVITYRGESRNDCGLVCV